MYQLKSLDDTIVAIATPPGQGGIGIVRLSGQRALGIADKIFVAKNNQKPSTFKNFTAHYGWVIRHGNGNESSQMVDEALLMVMRAPKSYTKEEVVEISCHGGMVVLKMILNLAVGGGARLAEPGEFTKRAFLNGRIDLTQAEAVLDIIQAKTEAFLRVSHNQLKGELSLELEAIREELMNIYTEIEAIVNFPEDEIEAQGWVELRQSIQKAERRVDKLLQSSEEGKILREGIRIVLCGKSNVGKSSLLNTLLRQPRAIVTAIAGTTRDTIEETAQIQGHPFQLVDTAGILEPRDLVEAEAIKRTHMYINGADLILFVVDSSHPLSIEDDRLMERIKGKNVLVVMNKCDLKNQVDEESLRKFFYGENIVRTSALTHSGIEDLEQAIVNMVWRGGVQQSHGVLITNLRHQEALKNCQENLLRAKQILSQHLSLEFASEEIKSAVNALDSITGRNIDTDLLDKIFSGFCIGK